MDENDLLTTLDFAHAWDVEKYTARKRAERWAQKLGLTRVPARSPHGHKIFAYSRSDAERIIAAERERPARRKTNPIHKTKKAEEIAYQIGTAKRSDVMTVHELAERLNVSRARASQIARRLESGLNIQRVEARAASTQRIIAYKRLFGGDKLVHGSGGICPAAGRSKTLPPVAFDPFGDGRPEDVHRGPLSTRSAGLPC